LEEAYLKAALSTGLTIPKKKILLTIGNSFKESFLPFGKKLARLGYKIYATEGTSSYFKIFGVKTKVVRKGYEGGRNNVLNLIKRREVSFVINLRNIDITNNEKRKIEKEKSDGYQIRRTAADYNIPLLTNFNLAKLFIEAISRKKMADLKPEDWAFYL